MASARTSVRSNAKIILKVLLLGDGGVGKSCLMNRFSTNEFHVYGVSTNGVEFSNGRIDIDGDKYTLQIWDTAGQERFKTLRTPFYRGTDICILTYAVDDRFSFSNLQMWQKEFLYYANIKEDTQFPFIVIGNKSDVASHERAVSQLEMETWCKENSVTSCIETSAKNASNVQEAFKMAVQLWLQLENRADRDEILINDSVHLTSGYPDNRTRSRRTSCCVGTRNN